MKKSLATWPLIILMLGCQRQLETISPPEPSKGVTVGQAADALKAFFTELDATVETEFEHGVGCQELGCYSESVKCTTPTVVVCTVSIWINSDDTYADDGIEVNPVLSTGVVFDSSLSMAGNPLAACNRQKRNCEIALTGPEAVRHAQEKCGFAADGTIVRLIWDEANSRIAWRVQREHSILADVGASGESEPHCQTSD